MTQDNGNGPTTRKPDPKVVIPTMKVTPLPFHGQPRLPGLPPQKDVPADAVTLDSALLKSLPPETTPQKTAAVIIDPPSPPAVPPPVPGTGAAQVPDVLPTFVDDPGADDEKDAGETQQMRRTERIRPAVKAALVAVGLIAAVALVYAIVTMATGSGAKTQTATGTTAMPTTAAAPTGSATEIATQALDLANRQAATYNAFTAKLGTDLGGMDDRITALEKKLEAKDAEIARLRQTVTALEQSASKVEAADTEPAIEIDGQKAKPPAPTTGTDDLVIERDKRPNEVDPTTLYPSE